MRPAEQTYLFFLDNEGVLFDEQEQKIFHLNTTATFIWCMLEEGKERSSILTQMQETFALPPEDASKLYQETELLFQETGVLIGFRPTPETEPPLPSDPMPPLEYEDSIFIEAYHYRLLSSRILMRFSNTEQIRYIAPILNHLNDNPPDTPTVILDIIQEPSGTTTLCRNGIPELSCPHTNQLAPLAKSLVWQTAVNDHDFFLDIHAGVVSDGELCYLFPASPGSGKSTLTATLVHSGFDYFSDEVALLSEEAFHVQPVPLATCIKDTGIETLLPYFPKLQDLQEHLRTDGKRVRYMPPERNSLPPPDTQQPVGAIIFPDYRPDQQSQLISIPAIEALQLLMQECLIVKTQLDKEKVTGLIEWIERTACFRLHVSCLDEAASLMKTLSNELRDSHK